MTSPTAPVRARRLGLYGPFAALAIAVAAWSGGWLWMKSDVERRLDAAVAEQARAGGALTWGGRRIHGYPFRVDVDFTDIAWRASDGWGLAAPALKTEAFLFAPGHWVAVAPAGLTFTRPVGGSVTVAAKVLRASLSDTSGHPPSLSLEGIGLTFSPAIGAAPYFLRSASELHVHTRAGPADQGAFYVELDDGAPAPETPLGRVAGGKPVTIVIDAIYSHATALAGPTWPASVGAWAGAGGKIHMRQFRLQTGASVLNGRGDSLSVGGDGRLTGVLDATLAGGADALAALTQAGPIDRAALRIAGSALQIVHAGPPDHVTLDFADGRTRLGPVAIGPSPKVY